MRIFQPLKYNFIFKTQIFHLLCSLTVADYVTVGNQFRNKVVISTTTVAFNLSNASLRKRETVKNSTNRRLLYRLQDPRGQHRGRTTSLQEQLTAKQATDRSWNHSRKKRIKRVTDHSRKYFKPQLW